MHHALILILLAASATAGDWPMFRGPNTSGIAEGAAPPVRWDVATGSQIRWKTAIPGMGHSSPIVWGKQIYLTTAVNTSGPAVLDFEGNGDRTQDMARHSWHLYAIDADTGSMVWDRVVQEGVPRSKRHMKGSHANATPATDGKHIVAFFDSEGLYCYSPEGKLLWKQDLGIIDVGLVDDPREQWGPASSPILDNNLVIVQADMHKGSFVAAFDVESGKRVWTQTRDEMPSWSTPAIYHGPKRTELITISPRYIRGLDPMTGKELWRFHDDAQVKVPAPAIGDGLIFASGGWPQGRQFYALKPGGDGDVSVAPGNGPKGQLAWAAMKGGPYTPSPLVRGGYLYVIGDNGVFSCYRAATGEVLYQKRVPESGGGYSASPVAVGDLIYLSSQDGDIHVLKAGPKFELVASNHMGEPLMATPAVVGGVLYVRGKDHLWAIGAKR